jgi:hypothetical protein
LSLYLYVLSANDLGYLLEAACIAEYIHGILFLDGLNMVNNNFVDDSLLLMRVEREFIDGALACLDTSCFALGVVVSVHNYFFGKYGWMHL